LLSILIAVLPYALKKRAICFSHRGFLSFKTSK